MLEKERRGRGEGGRKEIPDESAESLDDAIRMQSAIH